ncbi:ABC-type nitrate/sulfonate/bicarbonate transport system substrate-binding protein [Pseudomonas psychrotolerans]|nr:ABC-type nitrate/sulfonate/bicarbonate transport system substrate-binding protein [Pseudomonas psychrotolerans]
MTIHTLNRRRLLGLAGTATAAALFGRLGYADDASDLHAGHAGHSGAAVAAASPVDFLQDTARWALPEPRKVRLAVNLNAVCLAPVTVADTQGIFKQHNLDVEFVNFGNSTEVLLESMATGKADAAVGMALRWLKALEQGFDVQLTGGTHGGCLRLLAREGGPGDLAALKGATIGVTDMAAADKNFFAMMLKRHGVDPSRDITWRVYPVDLLGPALDKGEIQAASGSDPMMYRVQAAARHRRAVQQPDGRLRQPELLRDRGQRHPGAPGEAGGSGHFPRHPAGPRLGGAASRGGGRALPAAHGEQLPRGVAGHSP